MEFQRSAVTMIFETGGQFVIAQFTENQAGWHRYEGERTYEDLQECMERVKRINHEVFNVSPLEALVIIQSAVLTEAKAKASAPS